jgi:hypothetical protein
MSSTIYDYYSADTWLDSCDSGQFCPRRLLAILASRWPDARMVERGQVVEVAAADDWATWLGKI